jgi:L-threonylcarbamoyladenylate synthase
VAARALLPGQYTLVLPNPARRFRWLCGDEPTAIGIRVPDLPDAARTIVERVGLVASTSANVHGGPDPRVLDEVPEELRAEVAVAIDGGELSGTPSTVIDLTGSEPQILRKGAGGVDEALGRLGTALR